jgi:hypothetical protein
LGGSHLLSGLGDRDQGQAYNAISTLLSGICTFGAIGFGLDRLFGTGPVLLVVGLLVGKGLAIYFIYARHFARFDEVKQALAAAPRVAGWSKTSPVAGSAPQEHPKADLSAWPYTKAARHAS